MTDAERWLTERLAAAPDSLRRRIHAALTPDGAATPAGGDFGGRLRGVAERLLDEARTGSPNRETAMALLAADALITLSCEWAAERE